MRGLQWMLADMAIQRDAARGLVTRGIERFCAVSAAHARGRSRQTLRDRSFGQSADAPVQICGGAITCEAGIRQVYRDARITHL